MAGVAVQTAIVEHGGCAPVPGSDDALMLAARDDRAAFETLLRRHWDSLSRYVARRVGDADAPDLCQDVLITVWKLRARYEPRGRFQAWLFAVARRRVMRHQRWLNVRRVFAARPSTDDGEGIPDALDGAIQREELAAMRAQIAKLPPELQDLLAMRCGAGLDYDVIAEITGVPAGTLRSRVSRALASLSDVMRGRAP